MMTTQTDLAKVLPLLGDRDQAFALSLSQAKRWSEKQAYWADVLYQRATAPKEVKEQAQATTGLTPIVDLFDRAAQKLKFPRINVTEEVVLKRAGANSKRAGAVNVTGPGGFGAATWYGAVERDGSLTEGRSMTDEVRALLVAIATDPEQAALAYGRRTGNCCFCNKELTDQRSTDAGYGPVCARNFGLSWGASEKLAA